MFLISLIFKHVAALYVYKQILTIFLPHVTDICFTGGPGPCFQFLPHMCLYSFRYVLYECVLLSLTYVCMRHWYISYHSVQATVQPCSGTLCQYVYM